MSNKYYLLINDDEVVETTLIEMGILGARKLIGFSNVFVTREIVTPKENTTRFKFSVPPANITREGPVSWSPELYNK